MNHVTAFFSDEKTAERAVRELIEGHFSPEDISILVTDQTGTHEETIEYDTGVTEGATSGVLIGGILGALGATLIATGVVVAPGLPLLGTGPLLAALRGLIAGAATGLPLGALAGLGSWTERIHIHAEGLKKGGIVIGVPAEHEHIDCARSIFLHAGADEVRS